MGVAAYQRGTLVVRRQHDEQVEEIYKAMEKGREIGPGSLVVADRSTTTH